LKRNVQTVQRKYEWSCMTRYGTGSYNNITDVIVIALYYTLINYYYSLPFDRIKTDTNNEAVVVKMPVEFRGTG